MAFFETSARGVEMGSLSDPRQGVKREWEEPPFLGGVEQASVSVGLLVLILEG
jgi:hypothetical protein